MALASPQLNEIGTVSNLCKLLLANAGTIEQIDVLFNGATNWAALVTQENVDAIQSYKDAGLTAQNILDAIYILKLVKVQIDSNLPSITILANL